MSNLHKAFFANVLANVIWGISSPVAKWSFQTLNPFDLILIRLAVPAIILFFFFRTHLQIKIKHIPAFLILGFCGMALNIGLYYIGISKTDSINGVLIESASPILLLIGAAVILKEKLTLKVVMGNILGLFGLIYLVSVPLFHTTIHATVLGNSLIVIATIASVLATLAHKEIADKYSTVTFMFWSFFIGALTFLPFYLVLHTPSVNVFAFPSLVGLSYSILLSAIIGYFLGYWSIKYMKASSVAVIGYVQPLAAPLVAIPLLHELPDSNFLFAMLLIFIGIFIAEQHLSKKSFYTPHMRHVQRHR